MKRARFCASPDVQPPSLATGCQGSMSLRLRFATGALALPLIGDEEADKLLNKLLGNRSRNQGLNRCVAWMATAKRVSRMKRRDALLRVLEHAAAFVSDGVPRKHVDPTRLAPGESNIKPQTSDPLLFPEQSIG
jgi:hypothetical protein